jgi:hypothetical protein
LPNAEDEFLNKLVNIHVLSLTLWSRLQLFAQKVDEKCLISYFLCGSPQNNFGPHKARKNLGLEDVKWKTDVKVGVASLHPTYLQMRNIFPCCCPNPLQFLVFDSETADEPISNMKPHVALRITVAQLLGRAAQSQLGEVGISAKYLVEMFYSLT